MKRVVIAAIWFFCGLNTSLYASESNLNSLSLSYSAEAREKYSDNDVKSFIYQWFAAFDHQREAGYFLNRMTETVNMEYPDFPIHSQADFLRWYRGVTDNIVWNSHHLDTIFVTGEQDTGWDVSYVVNWKARAKNGQRYDLMVRQTLHVIRIGDALKIASLEARIQATDKQVVH